MPAILILAACAASFEESGRLAALALQRRRGRVCAPVLLSFAFGYAAAELVLIGLLPLWAVEAGLAVLAVLAALAAWMMARRLGAAADVEAGSG